MSQGGLSYLKVKELRCFFFKESRNLEKVFFLFLRKTMGIQIRLIFLVNQREILFFFRRVEGCPQS